MMYGSSNSKKLNDILTSNSVSEMECLLLYLWVSIIYWIGFRMSNSPHFILILDPRQDGYLHPFMESTRGEKPRGRSFTNFRGDHGPWLVNTGGLYHILGPDRWWTRGSKKEKRFWDWICTPIRLRDSSRPWTLTPQHDPGVIQSHPFRQFSNESNRSYEEENILLPFRSSILLWPYS